MSSKNIGTPKYKWESNQQVKSPTNAYSYKEDRKIHIQYSPKNMPSQMPKYFKTNGIYRHASQQQFKRYVQPTQLNQQHTTLSTEEQYYVNHKTAYQPIRNIPPVIIAQPIAYQNRNYFKDAPSPTSIQHSSNRRVSPSSNSSPGFFKSKPKLVLKQSPPIPKLTIDNFRKLTKLGQGKFGKVYLVR